MTSLYEGKRYRPAVHRPLVDDLWDVWDSQKAVWVCAMKHPFHKAVEIADRLNASHEEKRKEMTDKCNHDPIFFPNGTCFVCMSVNAERVIERERCAMLVDELAAAWNNQKTGNSRPEEWADVIRSGASPKYPLGATVGNMETQEEFWVCNHCFTNKHEECLGLAFDPDEKNTFVCECEVKKPHPKRT